MPLCRASGTGGSNPPPLRKAKNGCWGPGSRDRAFACFGRVWCQLGGRVDDTHSCGTDENALDNKTLSPTASLIDIVRLTRSRVVLYWSRTGSGSVTEQGKCGW